MRMRHLRSASVLGLLALALVLGACTGGDDGAGVRTDSEQSDSGQGFVSGDGGSDFIEPGERGDSVEVSGSTLTEESLSLTDFEGDVIVVNVWGSWCAPCRAEAPALREVSEESAKDGVQFVGINTRDQRAAALAFEETYDIPYPSLFDPSGELQLAFRDSLPPNAIPSTIVIDREGRVAARVIGPTTYSQLSDLVDQVASEA